MSSKPTIRSSTRTGGNPAQNSAPTRSSARLQELARRYQNSTNSFSVSNSGEGPPVPSEVARNSAEGNLQVGILPPPRAAAASETLPPAHSTPPRTAFDSIMIASRFGSIDTPRTHSSQSGAHLIDVKEQQHAISRELQYHVVEAHESFAKDLYKDVFTDAAIDQYLRNSPKYQYKQKRWRTIPLGTDEKGLYLPFVELFQDILKCFGLRNSTVVRRNAWLTAFAKLSHKEDEATSHRTAPDFCVIGSGPAFSDSDEADTLGYQHIVSCFDAKLDVNMGKVVSEQIPQLGVYSRQIYSHQPNRHFVRSLIVTECNIRLLHYDRSGVQYSPTIDIGKEATTFVRLVLGLSSTDEVLVGFDTTICWRETDDDTFKGYIKTVDGNGEPIEYELIGKEPQFNRRSIRGRGTTCWLVLAPDGRRLIIKDSWRSEGRVPEHEFLEAAKGLDGVGQMISHEDGVETRDFRGASVGSYADFRNRVFSRVTMEEYGGSIDQFQSVLQVLCAFRDAIAGHRNLLYRLILHRDVSLNNILIGAPNARPGNRGVLIDLDMAIWVDRTESLAKADFRTGTRMFQSIMVLSSAEFGDKAPRHDYLDDLEAFFYVFCYLVLGFHEPGQIYQTLPIDMESWDADNHKIGLNYKSNFLFSPPDPKIAQGISDFWGPTCRRLFKGFYAIMRALVYEKLGIVRDDSEEGDLTVMHRNVKTHYGSILTLFDKAIAELESKPKSDEPLAPPAPPPPPSTPPPQQSRALRAAPPFPPDISKSLNGKRPSEDYPDDSPSAKRPKYNNRPLNPSSLQQSMEAQGENAGA